MIAIALGKVTVTTTGTPVLLSAVLATLGLPADLRVASLEFWPVISNSGTYVAVGLASTAPGNIGAAVMNISTGANVLKQLAAPAATGHEDHLCIHSSKNSNDVRVADYAVDAQKSADAFWVFGFQN